MRRVNGVKKMDGKIVITTDSIAPWAMGELENDDVLIKNSPKEDLIQSGKDAALREFDKSLEDKLPEELKKELTEGLKKDIGDLFK